MSARRASRSGRDRDGRARERVAAIVDRLPEARTVAHGSHLSLEVRRKRFGWFLADHHGDGRLAIHCKTSPTGREELLRELPDHAHVPKYVGHHGWVGLWLDVPGTEWSAVRDALLEAYRRTAPKTLAARLDSRAGPGGRTSGTAVSERSSRKRRTPEGSPRRSAGPVPEASPVAAEVALAWLERRGRKKKIAELNRYGITATRPFGVSVGDVKAYAKKLGKDHALAGDLWASGHYEARLLAIFVEDPGRVTAKQMNAWAADFDNWALVDTACFHLFDRTRHAWKKVAQWAGAKPEFTKRAAFALLWSLSVHDETAPDGAFTDGLKLVERGARDDRKLVSKAVNMALRAVGKRNRALNTAALRTAKRLAESDEAAPRWVGRHALRELQSSSVQERLVR